GYLRQTKVSCTQRARRKARLPYHSAITPGSVRTPVVAPFPQLAAVNVPACPSKVGQVPLVAVKRSVNGRSCVVTSAAKLGAVSMPVPPVRIASRQKDNTCDANRGSRR